MLVRRLRERAAVPPIPPRMKYLEAGGEHSGCCHVTAQDRLIIYSSYFRLEVDNMGMSPTQVIKITVSTSIKMDPSLCFSRLADSDDTSGSFAFHSSPL